MPRGFVVVDEQGDRTFIKWPLWRRMWNRYLHWRPWKPRPVGVYAHTGAPAYDWGCNGCLPWVELTGEDLERYMRSFGAKQSGDASDSTLP